MSLITQRKRELISLTLLIIGLVIAFSLIQIAEKVKEKSEKLKIKYVSLPEEIGEAKPGDTITVKITEDTLIMSFYRKEFDSTYYVIK